jgi:hypothetical protein
MVFFGEFCEGMELSSVSFYEFNPGVESVEALTLWWSIGV